MSTININNADAIYFGDRHVDRVYLGAQRVWPPLTLTERVRARFGSAVAGMYDFTSPEGLYQDAAGTAPVTALGQPVGLVLDRRFGLVRGQRLEANGDFATSVDGWGVFNSANVFVSWQSPGLLHSEGSAGGAYQDVPVTAGSQVEIVVRLRVLAGEMRLRAFQGGAFSEQLHQSVISIATEFADYKMIVQSPTGSVRVYLNGVNGHVVDVDSVSVREVPGHHLSQTTPPARPAYTAQGARHDGVDDFLQAALAEDWTFLHDGSGGTLGIGGSWEGESGGNGVSGTQGTATQSIGTSLGLQSFTTSRGYWRAGDGSAVVAASSATGTWPASSLKRLLMSYATPTILRWDDGIRQSDLDASGLSPSTSPPSNPLRTIINPANGAIHYRRRIIAISEAVTDPADIALLDAWLREGG